MPMVKGGRITEGELTALHEAFEELEDPRLGSLLDRVCGLRAIALLQHGMAPVDVARHVGVDRRSVRRWRASHDRAGQAGLGAKPAPGRPPKLDARRRTRLERVLLLRVLSSQFE
jgi:hypothetical protein